MRLVIQRVNHASVVIEGKIYSQIKQGLLVLIGIHGTDNKDDVNWLASKVAAMRLFADSEGKMNLSIQDTLGEILVVSQFTLFASTKKGNRPGFTESATADVAFPLYEYFISKLQELCVVKIQTGVFGADMQILLENNGPVTIFIDSKNKE